MISVIMLTYNREKLVSKAIESVLKQSCCDFEYIIVDNGSTDKSGAIADEYAKKDERIKVIHCERGSIGAGRNIGIDASKGGYIAFIDDDDWFESDFLEFSLDLIKENNADIAICGTSDKAFDERRIMSAEEAIIELLWRKRYNMAFPAKLFKRELFAENRFLDNTRFDDIYLMHKIIADAEIIAYDGTPKYTFYRHENNNSLWTTNHKLIDAAILDEYLGVYITRTEWLSERFPNSAPTFRYFEWSFMISMVEKIERLEIKGCEKQLALMTKELETHRNDFLKCPEISDFEKEWMKKYITQIQEK